MWINSPKGNPTLRLYFHLKTVFFENLDCIAKNIIISALDPNEFLRISKCISTKDMWETLESTHEGSSGIVWQDDEISSSGSSSKVTKPNLCLMTKAESTSSIRTNSSINDENYYQLLEAFKETHEEPCRLTLLNNQLKSKNNWLENRVKILKEELNNSKTVFENKEMIYQNSSCNYDSISYENCESFPRKFCIL